MIGKHALVAEAVWIFVPGQRYVSLRPLKFFARELTEPPLKNVIRILVNFFIVFGEKTSEDIFWVKNVGR